MIRTTSVITNSQNIEHLYTIKNFPVYMGCVNDSNVDLDIKKDAVFDICKDTGIIQLRNVFPLEMTNPFPHNDGVGSVWESHNKLLLNFIDEFKCKNVIELGGGSGKLATQYLKNNKNSKWTIYDKNYSGIIHKNLKIKQEWFDEKISLKQYDLLIHSHLFEHIHDPNTFLKNIRGKINEKCIHVFSIPNLYEWLKNKHINCLNFEHTLFLTEEIVDVLLLNNGFKVIKKQKYGTHSIFYACEPCVPVVTPFKNNYKKYKKLFVNFINYNNNLIKKINKQIKNRKNLYLFGAHIFSQYLISNGLNIKNIKCILDNGSLKQSKRLYGTKFFVKSPIILKDEKYATVIVYMGPYTSEIKKDIYKNINKKVKFI